MADKVDMIVLTINNLSDTKEFIDYLYANTDSELFQLIIVDQGSTDGTKQYLEELRMTKNNVILHFSERNLGFAGGCNVGASYGTGELILFVNNDALLGPHVLERLIQAKEVNHYDAVGPISNETGEIQRLWKEYDTKNYQNELIRHNNELWQEFGLEVAEFHRLAGFCLLLSRKSFEKVHGFSEAYGTGYYEDDDLSFRLKNAGFKLGVACGVFVHHHGSRSFKQAKMSSNDLMAKNRYVFLGKTYYQLRPVIDRINPPLVSVIICTYNRTDLLVRAIESVMGQSYTKFELIIVRDGGIDPKSVVTQFQDERILYISNDDNRGKSSALNIGLNVAKGDFIAYLDDDDFYLDNHLEVLVNAIIYTGVDFVYSDSEERTIDLNNRVLTAYKSGNEFNIQRIENANFIPNLAILHKNRNEFRYDESLKVLEDWDFLRRCAIEFGAEFAHIPVLTNVYYVRLDGQSRNGMIKHDRPSYFTAFNKISGNGVWWISSPHSSEALRYKSWMILNPTYRINWLKKSLNANNWNVFTQIDLADLYIKNGNYIDAIPILNKSVTLYPENYYKAVQLLEFFLSKDQFDEAINLGGLALLLAPDSVSIETIYEKLSRAYSTHNRTTSLLCYRKLQYLRNSHLNIVNSRNNLELMKVIVKKIYIKFKKEGFVGVISAIKKRL